MTGGPPAAAGTGVVVEVLLVVPEVPAGLWRPFTCGPPDGGAAPAWVGAGLVAVDAGSAVGPEVPVSETTRAIAAATTSAPTTTTEMINQRSGPVGSIASVRVLIGTAARGCVARGRRRRSWQWWGKAALRRPRPQDGALHGPERAPTGHALGRLVRLLIRHWSLRSQFFPLRTDL